MTPLTNWCCRHSILETPLSACWSDTVPPPCCCCSCRRCRLVDGSGGKFVRFGTQYCFACSGAGCLQHRRATGDGVGRAIHGEWLEEDEGRGTSRRKNIKSHSDVADITHGTRHRLNTAAECKTESVLSEFYCAELHKRGICHAISVCLTLTVNYAQCGNIAILFFWFSICALTVFLCVFLPFKWHIAYDLSDNMYRLQL